MRKNKGLKNSATVNMGHFKGKPVAQLRPDDKDLFLESGFTIVDEHPEGRYCILGKGEMIPREGKPPVPVIHVFHLKKFGPPTRLTWTRKEYERIGSLFSTIEPEIVTVEVTQCSNPKAWYNDFIGMRFEVFNPPQYFQGPEHLKYQLVSAIEDSGMVENVSYIRESDCRIIDPWKGSDDNAAGENPS